MTEEEFSGLFDADEQELLGELGATLKATPPLELPADFARQTARVAEERFQRLPALSKLAVRLEPVLGAPVASPRAFPFTLGLLGGTVLGGVLGQQAIADLGLGLLAVAVLWTLLSSLCLPRAGPSPAYLLPERGLAIFYLLPWLCVATTAIFCGGAVLALSIFSINFKVASWNTVLLGPVAGLAVFFYLLSALMPSWRALQRQSVGRPRWMVPVQLCHAAWFGILASILLGLHDARLSSLVWLPTLLVAVLVSWMLSSRRTLEDAGRPALWRALHKTVRSLILGGLPIVTLLVCAYQATLTRQVEQQQLYESAMSEASAWVKEQEAIPPDQNGWTLIRAAMLNRTPQRSDLELQLKAGSTLYEPHSPAMWSKAREDFLKGLPTVRAALARPYLSVVATEGFEMQSRVPNFSLARSTSQGLTALAREAIERHQTEEALGYQLTNFTWSAAFRGGSLVSLMISAAQESIAVENVERWVFETRPEADQLRRMLAGLRAAQLKREDLDQAMNREIYLANGAFTRLMRGDLDGFEDLGANSGQGGWQVLVKILPTSYWRSEHKAYLNVVLGDQEGRKELGRPNAVEPGELLPFSYAASQLAPMTLRAQAQVMMSLTRFQALEAVVALELYQREHGAYPESLADLVPQYLAEVPKDVISPNLWARKPALGYARSATGYALTSQSPVYETVNCRYHQAFGPDGNYKLDKLVVDQSK